MNGNDKQSAAAQEALVCERCGRCRDGDFANCKNARSLAEASKAAIPFVAYAYSKGIDGAESAGRAIESALVASVDAATAWADGYASGLIDERTSDDNIGIAGFGAKIDPARANPYLLAAPVAAAPVCGDCSTPLLYECIGCSATNYPPRTPAAPGIDLATAIRNCCEAEKADPDHPDTICISVNDLTVILQQCVIDASPKGGSAPPNGYTKLVWVNDSFGNLIDELERAERKGYLPDSLCELMQEFDYLQATSAEVGS